MALPMLFLLRRPSGTQASFFELDLVTYLRDVSGLTVYPGHIPQKAALPAMSFFVVWGDQDSKLGGGAGVAYKRVQIAVSGRAYMDVGRISEQLRLGLHGFKQKLMGQTLVSSVLLGNEVASYEAGVDASDKGVHRKISEFTFQYEVSIPTP